MSPRDCTRGQLGKQIDMRLIEGRLPGVKANLLPHYRPNTDRDDSSYHPDRPRRHPLPSRPARLCRRNLSEPCLLAREGLLPRLALGFLTRSAGGKIGDTLFIEALVEVAARGKPPSGAQPVAAMIEPNLEPIIARPFASRPLHSLEELQIGNIGIEPRAQCRPLPQQALMRQLDDIDAGPPIGDEQPGVDELEHGRHVMTQAYCERRDFPVPTRWLYAGTMISLDPITAINPPSAR